MFLAIMEIALNPKPLNLNLGCSGGSGRLPMITNTAVLDSILCIIVIYAASNRHTGSYLGLYSDSGYTVRQVYTRFLKIGAVLRGLCSNNDSGYTVRRIHTSFLKIGALPTGPCNEALVQLSGM